MYNENLSKSTDHGTDFKWSIIGGVRFTELEYHYSGIIWAIVWDPNKANDKGEWSVCGGGQLERFYCPQPV